MLKWIQDEYEAEVVALTINLGQPGEDYDVVKGKAEQLGAVAAEVVDAREEFAREYVVPAIKANAIYGLGYPLFTALGRPLIAKLAVEYARQHGCDTIAHGCTGKGNDQVRIEATVATLAPELKVIAPVRGWQMGREEEIAYAREHGIPVKGGAETDAVLDRRQPLGPLLGGPLDRGPRRTRPTTTSSSSSRVPRRRPTSRRPSRSSSSAASRSRSTASASGLVELLERAAEIGIRHGVGIVDHIEDRIVGLKVRDIYEVPAAAILLPAHAELERLVGTIHQNQFKGELDRKWAYLVYAGLWWEPLRTDLDAYMDSVNEQVTGTIGMKLYKGIGARRHARVAERRLRRRSWRRSRRPAGCSRSRPRPGSSSCGRCSRGWRTDCGSRARRVASEHVLQGTRLRGLEGRQVVCRPPAPARTAGRRASGSPRSPRRPSRSARSATSTPEAARAPGPAGPSARATTLRAWRRIHPTSWPSGARAGRAATSSRSTAVPPRTTRPACEAARHEVAVLTARVGETVAERDRMAALAARRREQLRRRARARDGAAGPRPRGRRRRRPRARPARRAHGDGGVAARPGDRAARADPRAPRAGGRARRARARARRRRRGAAPASRPPRAPTSSATSPRARRPRSRSRPSARGRRTSRRRSRRCAPSSRRCTRARDRTLGAEERMRAARAAELGALRASSERPAGRQAGRRTAHPRSRRRSWPGPRSGCGRRGHRTRPTRGPAAEDVRRASRAAGRGRPGLRSQAPRRRAAPVARCPPRPRRRRSREAAGPRRAARSAACAASCTACSSAALGLQPPRPADPATCARSSAAVPASTAPAATYRRDAGDPVGPHRSIRPATYPRSPVSTPSCAHLHVHSEYSLLDGAVQDRRARRARGRVRPAGARADRPRRHERRGRALQGVPEARHQADRRLRDLPRRRPHGPQPGGRAGSSATT